MGFNSAFEGLILYFEFYLFYLCEKVNFTLEHTLKAQSGSAGIVLLLLEPQR